MTTDHTDHAGAVPPRKRWSIVHTLVVTLVLTGVAWLLTRHAEHAIRYLPLLVLLACPLMHLFMHRGHHHGHGGHAGHGGHEGHGSHHGDEHGDRPAGPTRSAP